MIWSKLDNFIYYCQHFKCFYCPSIVKIENPRHLQFKKMGTIDYVTQVTHLLVFDCKIGDFKIAGCVCLQKKFVCLQKKFVYFLSCEVFFGDF